MNRIYREIIKIGENLFKERLVNISSGNISVKIGKDILITKKGSSLGFLKESDIIKVGLVKSKRDRFASIELPVHKMIYKNTDALAIVHAHPIYAITLSLIKEKIIPLDAEAQYYFKEIPVVSVDNPIGSTELAQKVSRALKNNLIVVVKTHGSFAKGRTVKEANYFTSLLEQSSKIIYLHSLIKK